MNKIPVGRVIARSYQFVFRNYFALLGVLWLPMAITYAAAFLISWRLNGSFAMLPQQGAVMAHTAMFRFFPLIIAMNIVMLALVAVINVGIAKQTMGTRQGWRFAYLRFGADELRLTGGILLLLMLVYAAILVIAFMVMLVGIVFAFVLAASDGSQHDLHPAGLPRFVLPMIGSIFALIAIIGGYFAIRLGFLLLPVTVNEHKIGLWRSWELTRGNFWRSFAVVFATVMPILLVEFGIFFATVGPSYFQMLAHLSDPRAIADLMQFAVRAQRRTVPYIWGVGFVLSPIIYGLLAVPGMFAYRALIPEADRAPQPDAAIPTGNTQ